MPHELPETKVDLSEESHESKEDQQFAERLSGFFHSPRFLEHFEKIDGLGKKSDFVGATTEYFVLNPDGAGADEFAKEIFNQKETKKDKEELLIESVKRRLGIDVPTDDLDEVTEMQVYNYIYDHMIRNGYAFHGFNGAFESSIRESGLDPSKVLWEKNKIDKVADIGDRYGLGFLTGMHKVRMVSGFHTSTSKNYFDLMSGNFYSYALTSPEWFNMFCDIFAKNESAYITRNYEAAKENVENLISIIRRDTKTHPIPFTEEDAQVIWDLFEDCWQKLAIKEHGPKVALIKRRAIKRIQSGTPDYEVMLKMNLYEHRKDSQETNQFKLTPSRLLSRLLSSINFGSNDSVPYKFEPKDLVIIDLPQYSDTSNKTVA